MRDWINRYKSDSTPWRRTTEHAIIEAKNVKDYSTETILFLKLGGYTSVIDIIESAFNDDSNGVYLAGECGRFYDTYENLVYLYDESYSYIIWFTTY